MRHFQVITTIAAADNAEKVLDVPLGLKRGHILFIWGAGADGTATASLRFGPRDAKEGETLPADFDVAAMGGSVAAGTDTAWPAVNAIPVLMSGRLVVQRDSSTAGTLTVAFLKNQ